MVKICVGRYCELANEKVEQLYKVSSPCLADHQFLKKKENWKLLENCQKLALLNILKCLTMSRIGRLDFLWFVNKLARVVTQWTRACDRRLARLICYIHHTCDHIQYCHVGNTAQHCRVGLLHDPDFAGDFEDSKSTSVRIL